MILPSYLQHAMMDFPVTIRAKNDALFNLFSNSIPGISLDHRRRYGKFLFVGMMEVKTTRFAFRTLQTFQALLVLS